MAKNSLVALCSQYPEYRCTGSDYRLHSHASAFSQSAFIMVQRLSEATSNKDEEEEEEEKKLVQNDILG